MSQNTEIKISNDNLDKIIEHVVSCKFNGNCSEEVKNFAKDITIPLHLYNKLLMNKNRRKDDDIILNKSIGSFSLYDGKFTDGNKN